jgi:hypothetical protein
MEIARRVHRHLGAVLFLVATPVFVLISRLTYGDDGLRVACLPDRPVAYRGEDIGVQVWVTTSGGVPVVAKASVRWKVTGGRVEDQSSSTRWRFDSVEVDREYTASVEVEVDELRGDPCSFKVWVSEALRQSAERQSVQGIDVGGRHRGEYITRRAFLGNGKFGEPGFGLYSYFLMRGPPATPQVRERYAHFVRSFLDVLVSLSEKENYVESSKLNVSYMPMKTVPPKMLEIRQFVDWILEHYDYDRAKSFLSFYPTLTGPGPYIVAVGAPLRRPIKPMLPWDFAQMDGQSIGDGVNRFLNQAAQLYDWENEGALRKLRDRLLTAVAGMFMGRASAEAWIPIFE